MNAPFEPSDQAAYQCVFSDRYGSDEMRAIWSDRNKRLRWRAIWSELAAAQARLGIITQAQADDIARQRDRLDVPRSLEIERDTRHDLLSEARCYAEMCAVGGGAIHLGATSADIEDNADALRLRDALTLLDTRLRALLAAFAARVAETSALPTMGYTHLQAAEPTTVGYRLAQYLHDLQDDYVQLQRLRADLKGKGMKGAVGTSASYIELLVAGGASFEQALEQHGQMERQVMAALGIEAQTVATQTYSRKQDVRVAGLLASLAASIHKFCQDLRLLQSSPFAEWYEPRGALQVGSSTMPFKRNPTTSENVNGVCRIVMSLHGVFLSNAAHTILERTLDDSAGRGFGLPTMFIAIDDAVSKCSAIVTGLQFDRDAIEHNHRRYHVLTMTEKLLMLCVTRGAHRNAMHEHLRAMCAGLAGARPAGQAQDLRALIDADPEIARYLDAGDIAGVFDSSAYTGNCTQRCAALVAQVNALL